MTESVERRKHRRLRAESESFVFFMAEPGMAGRIVDIGIGGLGFSYLASKRRTTDVIDLTLVSPPHNYRSQPISIRVVSDFRMAKEAPNGERRCGGAFDRLTEDEQVDISNFIECCTTGVA